MAIDRAAVILIICIVVAIAAVLFVAGVFLWLDRRRTLRLRQITLQGKGKDAKLDAGPTTTDHSTSASQVPPVRVGVPFPHSESLQSQSRSQGAGRPAPLDQVYYYPPQRFQSNSAPIRPVQDWGIDIAPMTTLPFSDSPARHSRTASSEGYRSQDRSGSSGKTPEARPRSILRKSSRSSTSLARASRSGSRTREGVHNNNNPSTITTPDVSLPSPWHARSTHSEQEDSDDILHFPLPPVPILRPETAVATRFPPSALARDRTSRRPRASTMYETRGPSVRVSFVEGGTWQSPPRLHRQPQQSQMQAQTQMQRQPQVQTQMQTQTRTQTQARRAATAPMDGFEALRMARVRSDLDIPLSAMRSEDFGFRLRGRGAADSGRLESRTDSGGL